MGLWDLQIKHYVFIDSLHCIQTSLEIGVVYLLSISKI